jgi:hypothetical protein
VWWTTWVRRVWSWRLRASKSPPKPPAIWSTGQSPNSWPPTAAGVCRCSSSSLSPATACGVRPDLTALIQAHRAAVRDAILDTTAALVAEQGLLSVTMSQIAESAGIGRATLYKYFPDVEAILFAWHERQITGHLAQLKELRDRPGDLGQRPEAVLEAYAFISHDRFSHDPPPRTRRAPASGCASHPSAAACPRLDQGPADRIRSDRQPPGGRRA